MAKVSVIITVYNESMYLNDCLDSLKKQTLKDFEAICVNDASTDNSLEILEKYAHNDKRFIIINNEVNVGLTKSRRRAIENACGEYVTLLDADDFLSCNALSEAVQALENNGADIALMDLQMYYDKENIKPYVKDCLPRVMSGDKAFCLCIEGKLHSVYLTKLGTYKRIPIDDSCRLYTDDSTARLHILTSKTVCLSKGKYFYRQHNESETHKININRFDYLIANLKLASEARKAGAQRDALKTLEEHRWKNIIAHYYLLKNSEQQFTDDEKSTINSLIQKCIESIDFSLLPLSLKLRPPYWPTNNYKTFQTYQRIYLLLRKIKRSIIPV